MVREEIFGREESLIEKVGKKGCCYLGKIVSYPAGRYEEGGAIYFDITSPHCILVVGKRGVDCLTPSAPPTLKTTLTRRMNRWAFGLGIGTTLTPTARGGG